MSPETNSSPLQIGRGLQKESKPLVTGRVDCQYFINLDFSEIRGFPGFPFQRATFWGPKSRMRSRQVVDASTAPAFEYQATSSLQPQDEGQISCGLPSKSLKITKKIS